MGGWSDDVRSFQGLATTPGAAVIEPIVQPPSFFPQLWDAQVYIAGRKGGTPADYFHSKPETQAAVDELGIREPFDAAVAAMKLDRSNFALHVRPASRAAQEASGPHAIVRRFSDVKSKPVHWLWPGRIARGKVSMLAGNPGLGKSQLTASLAAIVTRGGQWPVDRSKCERGSVIFLSAEDDAEDTIRPRLEAAGADLSRCLTLDAVVDGFDSSGGEVRRCFNLRKDLERLGEVLLGARDAALVVIDPISAYLGDANSHNNAEIRALLAPLGDLAAKHHVSVLGVSHLNKGGSSEALMRVTGSLAFVAAARAAYLVASDKDCPSRRLFLPLKNNLGRDSGGLAFTIEAVSVASQAGPIDTSRVCWESEAVSITADEAMAPSPDSEERSELEEATGFLQGLLMDGPVPSNQVFKDADAAGHSRATIRRAQRALAIEAVKDGMRGGWTWRLPPKMLKVHEDAHLKNMSAFGRNEHLRPDSRSDAELLDLVERVAAANGANAEEVELMKSSAMADTKAAWESFSKTAEGR